MPSAKIQSEQFSYYAGTVIDYSILSDYASFFASQRSASSAAMQPDPAAVIAWR